MQEELELASHQRGEVVQACPFFWVTRSDGHSLLLCLQSWHLAQSFGAAQDELAASSAGRDEAVRARS